METLWHGVTEIVEYGSIEVFVETPLANGFDFGFEFTDAALRL